MAQTYVKGNLYQISIIDFKPDPNQPRKVIDPEALDEMALVENLQRQDITSVEEAEAFHRLMVEQNYTQEQLRIH